MIFRRTYQTFSNPGLTMTKFLFLLGTLVSLSASSMILPEDPYAKVNEGPPMQVPAGLDHPAPDPSLSVPIGEGTLTEGGHPPPPLEKTVLTAKDEKR